MPKFLRNLIINYLANLLTLFALIWFLPNVSLGYPVGLEHFTWTSFTPHLPTLLTLALVFTLLLQCLQPLLKVIILPINILTLGLIGTAVYILMIWLAIWLIPELTISPLTIFGFNFGQTGTILIFAFLYSFVQSIILSFLK